MIFFCYTIPIILLFMNILISIYRIYLTFCSLKIYLTTVDMKYFYVLVNVFVI